ncbi:hypothetical protein [Actinomadura rayongensis]|uniref:hypothetical protein n=1 Tax=Actinomadura rayongensis TaxID=1429076 RepID=UPI0019289C9C|nr:hypothetical protein [Actinomadura rayongensis]
MKGDKIQVLVDTGEGTPRVFEMTATQGGRRVEVVVDGPLVTIREVKRTGKPVRSMRFPTERIVALIEMPIETAKGRHPTVSAVEEGSEAGPTDAGDDRPAFAARNLPAPLPTGGGRPSGRRPTTAPHQNPSRGRSAAGRSKKGKR